MALRHLRALREKRAVHALSVARARLTAACKLESDLGKTLDRHDRISAEEDAGLHDQMIARGFTRSDLLAAEDRNRSNAARRDRISQNYTMAQTDRRDQQAGVDARMRDLRLAVMGHEKMQLAGHDLAKPATDDEDIYDYD